MAKALSESNAVRPEWIDTLLDEGSSFVYQEVATNILSNESVEPNPEWVRKFIKSRNATSYLVSHAFTHPHWKNHPELLLEVLASQWLGRQVPMKDWEALLKLPHWRDNPVLLAVTDGNLTLDNLLEAVRTKSYLEKMQVAREPQAAPKGCSAQYQKL